MNEHDEAVYERGNRAAYALMLQECLKALGYEGIEAEHSSWLAEREWTVAKLRDLCAEFGDNDWPSNLHLADVIEKHLARYLWQKKLAQHE